MNNLIRTEEMQNQTAKADAGKARLSLVPFQIVYDIARVRERAFAPHAGLCRRHAQHRSGKRPAPFVARGVQYRFFVRAA